jgi:hypothetical protein
LAALWQDLQRGVPGRAHQLWLLFSLGHWADIYQVNLALPEPVETLETVLQPSLA